MSPEPRHEAAAPDAAAPEGIYDFPAAAARALINRGLPAAIVWEYCATLQDADAFWEFLDQLESSLCTDYALHWCYTCERYVPNTHDDLALHV